MVTASLKRKLDGIPDRKLRIIVSWFNEIKEERKLLFENINTECNKQWVARQEKGIQQSEMVKKKLKFWR